jgi:hypothetical protein
MCADSVSSLRKNFRRAGKLKNNWRTSTLVPGALAPAFSAFDRAVAFACVQAEPADARNARQRFTAKTHRCNRAEILHPGDFAGRVAFEAEQGIIATHAESVVGDTDQAAAAGLDFHADTRRFRVECIFDEFLHDAGGTFHHFTGRDLIRDVFG